jgi:tetratricopeptide (TPR) repeat protein
LALIYQARILGQENAISMGRPEAAVPLLERSFRSADEMAHQDPNDQSARGHVAMAGITLAKILRQRDAHRALDIYDHVLRHMAEIKDNGSFRRYEVSALAGSTYALRRLGRPADAQQKLDAAFEGLRHVKAYPSEKVKPGSEPDETLSALGDYDADNGNIAEAIGVYTKLLDAVVAWGSKPDTNLMDAVDVSRLYGALAVLHRRAGQADLASSFESRRVKLWRNWDANLPHNRFVLRQLDAASGAGE